MRCVESVLKRNTIWRERVSFVDTKPSKKPFCGVSRITLLLILALFLLLLIITFFLLKARKDDTVLVSVKRQDIVQRVSATGEVALQTDAMVNIGAEVSGKLKKLYVDVGSTVKAGQLVAVMEVPEQLSLLRQARASADASAGRLKEAKALAQQAQRDAARTEALYRQGAVSRVDSEAATTRYRTALAQVDAAAAALQQAEAEYQRQSTNLAKARIYSPISGTVLTVDAQEGEIITAGFTTTTILTVADLKRIQLDVPVDETDIARIRRGQSVEINVDAIKDRTFSGRVIKVSSGATLQQNVVSYNVVVAFNGQPQGLKPQMTATVIIDTGVVQDALVVPFEAVRSTNEGEAVYLPASQGEPFVARSVQTGASDEKMVQILSGLKYGQKVVLSSSRLDKQLEQEAGAGQ